MNYTQKKEKPFPAESFVEFSYANSLGSTYPVYPSGVSTQRDGWNVICGGHGYGKSERKCGNDFKRNV